MEAVQPVIVTAQNRLEATVEAAVQKAVEKALTRLHGREQEGPGFAFVTNEEAMRLLGLSRPTLARYRADGTLPYAKLGSSVYYRRSDIEALLEARMMTGDDGSQRRAA